MSLKTTVEAIMSSNPFFVEINANIKEVDELMKKEGISRVPIVENGKFIGMITERSLLDYSRQAFYDSDDSDEEQNLLTDYENLLAKNVVIIYPEDSALKATELMLKKHADCLVVVDWNHNLKGILTWRDVLLYLHKQLLEEIK